MTVVSTVRYRPRGHLEARAEELRASSSDVVALHEDPFRTQLTLRIRPTAATALEDALSARLPPANRVAEGASCSVLWLGPDEFLIDAPDATAGTLSAAVRQASGDAVSLVDVSAHRTTLCLTGPQARAVLETQCTVDLHPRAFDAGACAQTMVGRVPVIVWQTGTAPAYRLLVRASFASSLVDTLLDAIRAES